jgi:predicted GH43/DUF377 family glycosyl hydrolase
MSHLSLRRHGIVFRPESTRVIIRDFIPVSPQRVATIIGRTLSLSEEEVHRELERIRNDFAARHHDIEASFAGHYERVKAHIFTQRSLSEDRKQLIGAMFAGEYALESAALFNPSMVPHPDQADIPDGGLRIIVSLRATGEGHISSIEFREGMITRGGGIDFLPVSRYVAVPKVVPNPSYRKKLFTIKLHEMGFSNPCGAAVLAGLEEHFTRSDLIQSVARIRSESLLVSHDVQRTLDCIQWLADSNYELLFSPRLAISERIIFPVSANESNGIEDARFVRFTEDDGTVMYYATYTAYNGRAILPQFIETSDFLHFRILTLNGSAVQNKGMALFPRRVAGRYVMLSRQDDENIRIMFSDTLHYWEEAKILVRPAESWESVKVGNCGSPIETDAGWLVITHGVGPMRKYCIGAVLLDLADPTRVIGRLKQPLLAPEENEREGYVPNVVYSCGSLLHGDQLVIPYAMSDQVTAVASLPVRSLLEALMASRQTDAPTC